MAKTSVSSAVGSVAGIGIAFGSTGGTLLEDVKAFTGGLFAGV